MSITDYNKYLPEAESKGKLATFQDYSAATKAAAEEIPYGVAVQLGTDEQVNICNGSTPVGVALAQKIRDWVDPNADDQKYKTNDPVAVVRKGVIWVKAVEDVTAGDSAKVDNVTGDFRPSDTATTESVAFPSSAFKTSAVAGELAQLEINLP